jgi:hypothetical protein
MHVQQSASQDARKQTNDGQRALNRFDALMCSVSGAAPSRLRVARQGYSWMPVAQR